MLRSFDDSSVTEILAQCPDSRGLGLAVGNRLKRAAGFHIVESDSQRIVLGITGGTGAGKTSALGIVREMGGNVIDCDRLYREMLDDNQKLRDEINAAFPGVFSVDGVLDRQMLGEEVYARAESLYRLNAIVYKYLVPELKKRIAAEDGLCAVDAVNLLESGLDRLCDRTIAVTAPIELRVRRVMARDRISETYARLRISAQKSDEYYRGKCDYELSNAAESQETFLEEVRTFLKRLIGELRDEKRYGAREKQSLRGRKGELADA